MSVAREGTSDSIQVDFMKRLRILRYSDFIHTYRTLNVRVLRGVDRCNLFSVTMAGRRVNSFRCWSTGKSDFLLPEMGWRFAGLQIPPMAYPPSSTVSHLKKIVSISNLNDWLIVDGVLFVIRCMILLSNKAVQSNQWCTYLLFEALYSRTKRV